MLNEKQIEELARENLDNVISMQMIEEVAQEIPELKDAELYKGKVRANFTSSLLKTDDGIPLRPTVTTDQISTHDKVRGLIPFKSQITNAISNKMFELVKHAMKNAQLAILGHFVVIYENCKPIDVEMVVRKYAAKSTTKTSLFHHYFNLGKREFCGHKLPGNLVPNGPLPYIMDTPSTKVREGEEGEEISVSPEYLFKHGIVTPKQYAHLRNASIEIFGIGEAYLLPAGIILVDTKFEMGINHKGELCLIDEVLTPDSSRYWIKSNYEEKMRKGLDPESYSKQFARDIGKPGEPYSDEDRFEIACRYIESYQKLAGEEFRPVTENARERIFRELRTGLDSLL